MDENIKEIEHDIEEIQDDVKKINCFAVLDCIKHSIKCIYDTTTCCVGVREKKE